MEELRLYAKNNIPKIIGITEVKPKNFRYSIQNCELAIEHYEMYSVNLNNEDGRGVSLYIHESIEATQVDIDTDFVESVWVTIRLVSGDKLLVGCIYRSPNGQDSNDDSLRKLLTDVVSRDYTVIHY